MVRSIGSVLRASHLTDLGTGRRVRVPWPPRGVSVLLLAHPACAACDGYAEALGGEVDRFRDWGSSVLIVREEGAPAPDEVDEPGGGAATGTLVDDRGELHVAAAVGRGQAAVLVIDVHGQIFYSQEVGDHDFPAPAALALEARFPALQCPECDTPDVPGRSELPG